MEVAECEGLSVLQPVNVRLWSCHDQVTAHQWVLVCSPWPRLEPWRLGRRNAKPPVPITDNTRCLMNGNLVIRATRCAKIRLRNPS
eukprot:325490-Prymnesium_polylepis.2